MDLNELLPELPVEVPDVPELEVPDLDLPVVP